MNKDIANKYLDELKSTFEIMPSNSAHDLKYKKIIQRNFIVSLYSIWETYIKSRLYDMYTINEDLLYNEEFLTKYFEKIFSKKYINKLFLKNISNSNIQKEILFDSNNLNWYEFESFIKLLGFDINQLKNRLTDKVELDKIIKILEDKGLTPLYNEKNTETSLKIKRIVGYIQLIVENRNQISHNYNPYISENLNKIKASILIHFLKVLIGEIDLFINSQIAIKVKESGNLEDILEVPRIIRSCNADINQTCIMEITIPRNFKGLPNNIYIKSESGNIEEGKIIGIQYKNVKLSKIIYDKPIAIEVKVPMKIKSRRKYYICARKTVNNKMKVIHTTYDLSNLSSYYS